MGVLILVKIEKELHLTMWLSFIFSKTKFIGIPVIVSHNVVNDAVPNVRREVNF